MAQRKLKATEVLPTHYHTLQSIALGQMPGGIVPACDNQTRQPVPSKQRGARCNANGLSAPEAARGAEGTPPTQAASGADGRCGADTTRVNRARPTSSPTVHLTEAQQLQAAVDAEAPSDWSAPSTLSDDVNDLQPPSSTHTQPKTRCAFYGSQLLWVPTARIEEANRVMEQLRSTRTDWTTDGWNRSASHVMRTFDYQPPGWKIRVRRACDTEVPAPASSNSLFGPPHFLSWRDLEEMNSPPPRRRAARGAKGTRRKGKRNATDAVPPSPRTTAALAYHQDAIGSKRLPPKIANARNRKRMAGVTDNNTLESSEDNAPLVTARHPACQPCQPVTPKVPPALKLRGVIGMMQHLVYHCDSTALANYDHKGVVAYMQPTSPPAKSLKFTPQPVVNWLYQAAAYAITILQHHLGTRARFNEHGEFVDVETNSPASGGQVCGVWGTELGARREQALIAWDYDVDLAVFITEDFVFSELWLEVKKALEPLGLQCLEHDKGYKFRIAPLQPVAFNYWQARRHEAKLNNPGLARPKLLQLASIRRKHHEVLQNPTGINCVDIEVHTVKAASQRDNAPLTIGMTGQACGKFEASPQSIFPIVEGILGPLRIPLPHSPRMLSREYGEDWATVRRMKVVDGKCKSRLDLVRGTFKRCAWPSIRLQDCEALAGGFWGAGVEQADDDIPWRFL